jgi:hypothetical protein
MLSMPCSYTVKIDFPAEVRLSGILKKGASVRELTLEVNSASATSVAANPAAAMAMSNWVVHSSAAWAIGNRDHNRRHGSLRWAGAMTVQDACAGWELTDNASRALLAAVGLADDQAEKTETTSGLAVRLVTNSNISTCISVYYVACDIKYCPSKFGHVYSANMRAHLRGACACSSILCPCVRGKTQECCEENSHRHDYLSRNQRVNQSRDQDS